MCHGQRFGSVHEPAVDDTPNNDAPNNDDGARRNHIDDRSDDDNDDGARRNHIDDRSDDDNTPVGRFTSDVTT
jgi:hypothetical protein